jgi:hypothetical protein
MKWSSGLATVAGSVAGLLAAVALLRPGRHQPAVEWRDLVEWFTRRAKVKGGDKDNIAFTLLRRPLPPEGTAEPAISVEKRSPAPVILVQGIYNRRTEQLVEARVLEADRLDEETAAAHARNELVIYE